MSSHTYSEMMLGVGKILKLRRLEKFAFLYRSSEYDDEFETPMKNAELSAHCIGLH